MAFCGKLTKFLRLQAFPKIISSKQFCKCNCGNGGFFSQQQQLPFKNSQIQKRCFMRHTTNIEAFCRENRFLSNELNSDLNFLLKISCCGGFYAPPYRPRSSFSKHEKRKLRNYWKRLVLDRKIQNNLENRAKTDRNSLLKRTAELRENIFTIPNGLCVLRIGLSPVIGYLVVGEHFGAALTVFCVAGTTDLFDGWIARTYPGQQSLLGSALDPLADKLLVSILFLSLTYAGLIPVPLTLLVIARDVGLVGAAFYVRYKTLPPPITLSRYFDLSRMSARVKPTLISKVVTANTAVQLGFVAVTLAAPVFNYVESSALHALWYLTAATTVWSGLSYLYSANTFELVRKTPRKARLPKYFRNMRNNNQNKGKS